MDETDFDGLAKDVMMAPHSIQPRKFQPHTRQGAVFGAGIFFMVFTSIVMGLRLYTRIVIVKGLGMDDALMLLGTIFAFGLSIATMIASYYGVGMHLSQIPLSDYTPMLQATYATRLFYVTSVFFIKMSLLVFYLRLDQRPKMRWVVYFLMISVTGFSIASFFVLAFSCTPPSMFWDTTGTIKGHCMGTGEQQQFYNANGIINIVLDVAIYITPMPMILSVQLPLRRKLGLMFVFGLGFIAVAAGGVRFAYVQLLAGEREQYYSLADSQNWCGIEIYVAIFCGSASSLKVCIQARFPQFFGSSATNSHKKSRRSRSGPVFALKTFGGSPMTPVHTAGKNTSSSSQYAGLGSTHSQEAIVGSSRDVMVKKKFWVDVSDGKGERVKHDQGVGAIP